MAHLKIKLAPIIYSGLLTIEAVDEVYLGFQAERRDHRIIVLDWDDEEYPLFKEFLISCYGEEMRQHGQIVLSAV